MNNQLMRFIIVGATAAAANIGSRVLFDRWMDYVPAMVLAFVIGLSTAFVLNRHWVFLKSGKHWLVEACWFFAVNIFGLLQTVAISLVLARYVLPSLGILEFAELIAHSIGVVIPVITSYLGHKHVTFRKAA